MELVGYLLHRAVSKTAKNMLLPKLKGYFLAQKPEKNMLLPKFKGYFLA